MRTVAERTKRKNLYRMISVVFVLVGVGRLTLAFLQRNTLPAGAFLIVLESATMWLLFGATWTALSRTWGELADSQTDSQAD
jgi:hypothetical protein